MRRAEAHSDEEAERLWGHPSIEYLRGPARPGWLLLTSDGACEPHEDADRDLAGYLTGDPHTAGERLVGDAVRRAHELSGPYVDNATVLLAAPPACDVAPAAAALAAWLPVTAIRPRCTDAG
ncbi:hypothetical protein AB0E62_35840 [Streptomyces sp. NPDC038707]|uniref:hypothetical protein n=1 Tax=unclassified Streptomyces TaxID=2593676 RepID=UPI0033E31BBF